MINMEMKILMLIIIITNNIIRKMIFKHRIYLIFFSQMLLMQDFKMGFSEEEIGF